MKNPLFALLAAGIIAILCSDQLPASSLHIKISIGSIIFLLLLCKFIQHTKTILFTCISISFFTLHQIQQYFPNVTTSQLSNYYLVQEQPEVRKNNVRIKTRVLYSKAVPSLPDYCFINIQKELIDFHTINVGDTIYTQTQARITRRSLSSPFQFDYATYLLRRRIAYTIYLFHPSFVVKHQHPIKKGWIKPIQEYLLNCLQQSIPNNQNALLAASLIIGQKADLNPEMISNYSKIGIIHLLSVSGLHVGIFLWLIHFLFSYQKNQKKYLQYITIICFLIFYTIITGASIPVIRCAIMFTFLETGKLFRRQSSIIHTLFGSAMLLLLYNTQFLFDIGFQLSYLALTGIIVLQPYLVKKMFFQNKLLQHTYDMICATFSAWVFTFPAVVFYFHNLSLLGNLTNLIAIPLAACILYLGLLLILLSGFQSISLCIGKIINACIDGLNSIVSWSIHLPLSYIDNIYWSPPIIILQYAVILLIVFYLYTKNRQFFYYMLCCLLLINLQFLLPKKKSIQLYFENQSMLLTLNDQNTLFFNTNKLNKQTQQLLQLSQSYYGVDSICQFTTPLFTFNNHSYLVIDNINYAIDSVDYLIICSNKSESILKQLNHTFVRKQIIGHMKTAPFQKLKAFLEHKKSKVKCTNAVKFAIIQ